ncbi:class Ib ribonucleoside-diphosphate reductase assembly flavoprotein NrdI [Salipiger bermudensis]|uniref:class Ib ribonucleoside-diphosphate reductase assembly flavoprotein NrdI n=1 Tax=Salipiger bermudensis TaxID=344736 RepID=UPI001CD1DA2E|nr:class Ib ribonucleoside-diphosphate reductase assembly flavoprotein NrdI [Salipiger bermudensis]MCA0961584.1 class Ib ribonucleoside-diphosphate reductase assembly flavoprotein NrdI [Salipiger bermudensis]
MPGIVFFSSASGNTARFVNALGMMASRIPVSPKAVLPALPDEYVLICPTYADGEGRGAVPKQVIHFLNDPDHRRRLRGVIGGGNRNFGTTYGIAADVIAKKCSVPLLYKFELAGTLTDIARVRDGLHAFWGTECLTA